MKDLHWTKTRSQEIVGREYMEREIRKRIQGFLPGKNYKLTPEGREAVLAEVLSDDFLRWVNQQTVGSVVRNAQDRALDHWLANEDHRG